MDHVLKNLANQLILAIQTLEKKESDTSAQEKEKSLNTICSVLELKIDLNKKVIDGIFFATLNIYLSQTSPESQKISILKTLIKLFENYSQKEYFLSRSTENSNLVALLIKLTIQNITVFFKASTFSLR